MNIVTDSFWDKLIDRLKIWSIPVMLILIPISFPNDGSDHRRFQEMAMMLAFISYASLYLGNIWLTLFNLLGICMSIYVGGNEAMNQTLNIFLFSVIFASSRWLFLKRPRLDLITIPLKIVCFLTILWMILQTLGIDPIYLGRESTGKLAHYKTFSLNTGLFNLPACNGMFLALCLPFFIATNWILGLLLLYPIYKSHSAIVYLASAIAIFYSLFFIRMVVFKRKILYWILGASILALGAFGAYKDYSGDKLTGLSRFESWHMEFREASKKPIFGYGPASFANMNKIKDFTFNSDEDYNPGIMREVEPGKALFRYHSADEGKRLERFKGRMPKSIANWNEAHNEYLQLFFEYGIVGCLIIFALIYEIWLRFKLNTDSKEVRILFGALIVYAILSTFQFPFHLARNIVYLPFILGAFYAFTDKDYEMFTKPEGEGYDYSS